MLFVKSLSLLNETRWTFFRVKLVFEFEFEISLSLGPLDLWTQRPWDSWTIGLWDLFPPIPPLLISSSYNILPLFISFFLLLLLPSTSFYFPLHCCTSSYLTLQYSVNTSLIKIMCWSMLLKSFLAVVHLEERLHK